MRGSYLEEREVRAETEFHAASRFVRHPPDHDVGGCHVDIAKMPFERARWEERAGTHCRMDQIHRLHAGARGVAGGQAKAGAQQHICLSRQRRSHPRFVLMMRFASLIAARATPVDCEP